MVRAKDLYIPFPKNKKLPVYYDQVLALPHAADVAQFAFIGWNSYFPQNFPLYVEYCSGNGDWIVHKAKEHPDRNFLAVEMRIDRARKIWSKCKNAQLSNLIVAWAEGLSFTKHFLLDSSVKAVYVNFPDPWPKRKHAKNRILDNAFIEELKRILEPQGTATVVTDDGSYSTSIIETFSRSPSFRSCIETPFFQEPPEDYGTSYFNELFRTQSKLIRFHQFEKKHD